MKNAEVDIYVSQMVRFFEINPNELFTLIGDLNKEDFYEKIKEAAYSNFEKEGEANLTRSQMLEIIVNIHREKEMEGVDKRIYFYTKFGPVFLN
jgi:hypothetical protein